MTSVCWEASLRWCTQASWGRYRKKAPLASNFYLDPWKHQTEAKMRWGRRNRAGGSQPKVWLAGPSMTKNTPSSAQGLGMQCSLPNVPLVSSNTWSWRRTALSVSLCLRSVIFCPEMMGFHSASSALKHCELLVLGTETHSENNVSFHLFLDILKSHSVDVQFFLSMGWVIYFKPFLYIV